MRPLIAAFFDWVSQARFTQHGPTLATKALGHATNQEQELRRVLADDRLPLDNTRSRALPPQVVVGRKNWMFMAATPTPRALLPSSASWLHAASTVSIPSNTSTRS
ncbi:MAG TPA: transposase, partial [Gemmatimonadales bacterium]|nr:transposase [Gemmatimonadales bacterium]